MIHFKPTRYPGVLSILVCLSCMTVPPGILAYSSPSQPRPRIGGSRLEREGAPILNIDEKLVFENRKNIHFAFEVLAVSSPTVEFHFTPCVFNVTRNELVPTSQGFKIEKIKIGIARDFEYYDIYYQNKHFEDSWMVKAYRVLVSTENKGPGIMTVTAHTGAQTTERHSFIYIRNFSELMLLSITSPTWQIFYGEVVTVQCQVDVYNFTSAISFEFGGNIVTVQGRQDEYAWSASISFRIVDKFVKCTGTNNNGRLVHTSLVFALPQSDKGAVIVINATHTPADGLQLDCQRPEGPVAWYKNGVLLKDEGSVLAIKLSPREPFTVVQCLDKSSRGTLYKTWQIRLSTRVQWFPLGVLITFGAMGILLGLMIPLSYTKILFSKPAAEAEEMEMDTVATEEQEAPQIPPEYDFPKEVLRFLRKLGEGTFGVVMMAKAIAIVDRVPCTNVAVSIVTNIDCDSVMHALIAELKMMIEVGQHLNIVNFLGAVTKNVHMRELMIMYELGSHGNLQEFLWNNRATFDASPRIPWRLPPHDINQAAPERYSIHDLVSFAAQIVNGMSFLVSRKMLHGSLAARKILLCDSRVVKIRDFGLTRSVFRSNVYRATTPGVPSAHKWLALESFTKQQFNVKTDVWSFGVVLWELFSLGATPYAAMATDKVLHEKLLDGYRLEQPEHASQEMYDLMLSCWYVNPSLRPTFYTMTHDLNRLLPSHTRSFYTDLNQPHLRANIRRVERLQGVHRAPESNEDDFIPATESQYIPS